MKLLIPSQCLELTREVQPVLLLAAQQCFAIGLVELGVSPSPYLQLFVDTTLSLSCNWFTHVQPDADWVLHYGAEAKDLSTSHVHDGWIFIGEEPHQGGVIDRWQHSDEVRYLLQVKTLEPADCWRHLAWVLACLSLDFPIEDALVLS
ncbi:thiamine phosphate synthase, partial [Vibrio cholerae]